MAIIKDWTKYLEPIVSGDGATSTTDLVGLPKRADVENNPDAVKLVSDFALMNDAVLDNNQGPTGHEGYYWLQDASDRDFIAGVVRPSGKIINEIVPESRIGLCPVIRLRLPDGVHSMADINREVGPIRQVGNNYIIELGEFPKNKVDAQTSQLLNSKYWYGQIRDDALQPTGRMFTSNGSDSHQGFASKQSPEFSYQGKKYAHVAGKSAGFNLGAYDHPNPYTYRDGTAVNELSSRQDWLEVAPITWRIKNAAEVLRGTAKALDLESHEIINCSIPFNPDCNQNRMGWKHSLIRAFLNSTRVPVLEHDTNQHQWDFSQSGFLYQALNMTREPVNIYTVPAAENKVAREALNGCVGLQKIIIPSHVNKIERFAFGGCMKTQIELHPNPHLTCEEHAFINTALQLIYLAKDGQSMVLSQREDPTLEQSHYKINPKMDLRMNFELGVDKFLHQNYRENFAQIKNWRDAGKVRFMPPDFTLRLFPSKEMKNYFINNNQQRWGQMVKSLGFDTLETGYRKDDALDGLMRIYYAIGGFSENQGESQRAMDYVMQYVAVKEKPQDTPEMIGAEIHRRFSRINLNGPYNPNFAKFFMKYYHDNPNFMYFELQDLNGEMMEGRDYLCAAHNSFAEIMRTYPNRVVNGNEERALLTPRFVAEHSTIITYDGVDQEHEALAGMVGRYGYNQEQFEQMCAIYDEAKYQSGVIQADPASGASGVTFRVLAKNDPLGFVLGDITNCCQHIGGPGESCVRDGYLNRDAGFLVFEANNTGTDGAVRKRILGQAYVWYDPETKTVCYDDIEMPTRVREELRSGAKHGEQISMSSFLNAVIESGDAMMSAMNRNGVAVQRVTIGKGYTPLSNELNGVLGKAQTPTAQHRSYSGYSDARGQQYVLRDDAIGLRYQWNHQMDRGREM